MAAFVRILSGPARSGKTAALVLRYRQILADEPIGSGLWIAPTQNAAREIRERLIADGLAGCFSPAVYTFQQFAQAVLTQADRPLRFVGTLLKRQLLERVLKTLGSENRLPYFGPIAATAGILDLIGGVISDLKRQEVWPEDFSKMAESVGSSDKHGELGAIYAEYQRLLNEHQLYDSEGRFWLARDFLQKRDPTEWGPFAALRHIAVDGFTDFTRTQHEILTLLVARAPDLDELTISLPLEKESVRGDLFDKPQFTLRELQELHARHRKLEITWQPRPASVPWPALDHVERRLFGNPRETQPASDSQGIEIVAAAGQKAEIELLARRIKDLLVLGDSVHGNTRVRPGEIAVVFRSLEPVASLVEEVFGECGIPVTIDWPARLVRSPLLQALLVFLRLQADDWPFRRLLAALTNNFFQPSWPEWRSANGAGESAWSVAAAAEWAVRKLQIPQGCEALLAELQRNTDRDESPQTTADGDPIDQADAIEQQEYRRRFRAARQLLSRLSTALVQLNRPRPLAQWIAAIQELADELGLLAATGENDSSFDDGLAWTELKAALAAVNQLDEDWLGAAARKLDLKQFINKLQEVLSIECLPDKRDDTGCVRVLSAQSIRALEVPYLFVAGLSEKSFPPAVRDDRIYSDAEFRRLNAAGLRFVDRRQRSCEELLLFYEVVTRATRRLTLSFPALDETAQPLLASPYVAELERCCGLQPEQRTREISLSPVPQHAHPYSPLERRVKAVSELLDDRPQRLAALVADSATAPIIGGLRTVAARSRRDEFGAWEGIFTGDAAQRQLADRFGPEHCWSVSRLEQYAECPFRFLAGSILKLEELPELSLGIDYGRRGVMAHDVLAQLHRRLNEAGTRRSPTDDAVEFDKLTKDTLSVLLERVSEFSPLRAALERIDVIQIGKWLGEYAGQHQKYEGATPPLDQPLRPAHFEVSFGMKRRAGEHVDPLSSSKPFELQCGDETIRLSGRIDRIDIGLVGDQVVFNVIDYKTSANQRLKLDDFKAGLAMQLPLYALAVQELLMIDRRAVPWRVGYWYLKDKGFESHGLAQFFESSAAGLRETAFWSDLRGTLLARVVEIVRGIRAGQFPVFNSDEHCTSHCPYHTVCRIGAIRAIDKRWGTGQ